MISELMAGWVSELRFRARAVFRRRAVERELDEELRFHVEREAEKYVRSGVPPGEAHRRARVAFGGMERVKEESRDVRGVSLLETFGQDLRYAARGLRSRPGFTAAVVVTLGLGIGVNAAMFGIVDRMLFRPPPYLRDAARVHRVYLFRHDGGTETAQSSFQYTRYADLARWTRSFSGSAAFHYRSMAVGVGDDAREMNVGAVSASFFDFFDARPVRGRFFVAREDSVPAGAPVAVLGHAYWLSRYGGGDVLGRQVRIGPVSYTIIGVAPDGFAGLESPQPPAAFVPITTYAGNVGIFDDPADYYRTYRWGWLQMIVRRRPGVSVEAADADLTQAFARSYAAHRALSPGIPPLDVARPRAIAAPVLRDRGPDGSTVAKVASWTTGVAFIVLLIACANVANLLLARALRRRREISVRLALGVSRRRLLSQLLTESMLLATLAGLAGLLLAQWGGTTLRALFVPGGSPSAWSTDARTLAFAAIAALVTGVLTGLAPALQAGRGDLASALKAGVREGTHDRSRLRAGLLLLQGTLSVVLLVGAGLFVRSLGNVRSLRLGYDVDPLLYVLTNMRGVKLTDSEQATLVRRLHDAAKTIPGVPSVSLAATVPFWNTWTEDLFVPGIDSVARLGSFTLQSASPEYFATMGTRLLRGRALQESDRAGAPLVMVVSEGMAKTLWPGRDAIGQCVKVGADTVPCTTVVGVAEDIKQSSLSEALGLQYYMPAEQFHPEAAGLFVRTGGDAAQLAETVRRRLQPLMPGASYVTVTPMREIVDPNERSWQLGATTFTAFGGLSLLLAAIGLYSVIAYNVAQRSHELGVRVALGAKSRDVVRLVVGEGVRFAIAGIVIGGAIALAAGRWVAPLLFGVSPRDPLVYGAVAALLISVALVASLIPALRASRIDPNSALRAE